MGHKRQVQAKERDRSAIKRAWCENKSDCMCMESRWEAHRWRCVLRSRKSPIMLIVACLDGTLHVWKADSNLARPNYSCETAHAKDTETTSVTFSRDGSRLVSRGGDGTIKRVSTSGLLGLF